MKAPALKRSINLLGLDALSLNRVSCMFFNHSITYGCPLVFPLVPFLLCADFIVCVTFQSSSQEIAHWNVRL